MNLLKALVLYVDQGYAEENRNIGEVYRLLTLNGESQLDTLLEALPSTHPAKAPYSLFKQASDTVRSGVIIGLGSRLQVFQSELIKKITAKNEIDLSFRVSSLVPTSSLPATRTVPLIFWPRCFYLLLHQTGTICRPQLRGWQTACACPYPWGRTDSVRHDPRPLPPAQRNTLPEYLHVLCIPKSRRIAEQIPAEFVAGDHWKL